MSGRAYFEINLHITWPVKGAQPVLVGEVEGHLHRHLQAQILKSDVRLHGIGGTDDHVHIVVSVPPTLILSEWIGRLKGASSHFINHDILNRKDLQWDEGYGVVSCGTKDIPWLVEYATTQRPRHAAGNVFDRLERTHPPEKDDQKQSE